MQQILDFYSYIKKNGNVRVDRTGVGTTSIFGYQMRFDISNGQLPLMTTKKLFLRGMYEELEWFIAGDTNNETLVAKNVHIWDSWALKEDVVVKASITDLLDRLANKLNIQQDEADRLFHQHNHGLWNKNDVPNHESTKAFFTNHGIDIDEPKVLIPKGSLGPIYSSQWRSWKTSTGETIDQVAQLIEGLKNKPFSRRHIVSAWNPEDLPDESISPQDNVKNGKMALSPCHCLFQFYVQEMSLKDRIDWYRWKEQPEDMVGDGSLLEKWLDDRNVPKLKLSCQLYQR